MYSIVIDLLPAFLAPFWSCWPLKEENADAPDELRATAVRTKAVDFMVDSGILAVDLCDEEYYDDGASFFVG